MRKVLIARKTNHNPYSALFIAEATTIQDLPASVIAFLIDIHADVETNLGLTAQTAETPETEVSAAEPTDIVAAGLAEDAAPSAGGDT